MKEMYETQIKDLLNKIDFSKERKSSKKPENFSSKTLMQNLQLEASIKRLEAENKFLKEQFDLKQGEIEIIKMNRDDLVNKIKEELNESERMASYAKVELAQVMFEKDTEVIKYRNVCKKLRAKIVTGDTNKKERKSSFFDFLYGGNK
jgi:hypothetical protein